MKYIGLSMSMCVKDILKGKVNINDVVGLITSTKVENEEDAVAVFLSYSRSYWAEFSVREIASVIIKIRSLPLIQTRVIGGEALNICDGHWMEANPNDTDMRGMIVLSLKALKDCVDSAEKITF